MKLWIKNTNKTPLHLILITEAFSSLTNQLMQLLLPWYVLSTTGNVLWTGIVGFCSLLPNIFSSLFGARVIEKAGRSKTMLSCEIIQLLLISAIPVLIVCKKDIPWVIGLIVLLISFFDAPGQMARTALSPTFSRYAGVPVSKTSGIVEAFDGIMSVAGPILGGIVIALWGLLPAWILCSSFCLIIVFLCLMVFTNRKPRILRPTAGYRQVFSFIRSDKTLYYPILFMLPTFILGQSWELVILPTYIYEQNFSALYLGFLGAAFGLGAFSGALLFAQRAKKFRFFSLLTLNYAGYLLSVAVLYFNLPKITILAATVLCGIPFGAFGAMITSIILLRTPDALRSKTLGLYAAVTYIVESASVLLIAYGLYSLGLQKMLFIITSLFAILIVLSLIFRQKEDFWSTLNLSENKVFTK